LRRVTAFPELDAVLDELVSTVEANLRESFRGAYVTGSFALGAQTSTATSISSS
jgi:hypothetical protein